MKISYKFRNPLLLKKALEHPSFTKSQDPSQSEYERLEFFGDSILSMVINEILYKNFSNATHSQLSIMHSNLVNSESLAEIARSINLGESLIIDSGEDMAGGRDSRTNLEDTMEALIAAIYLDSDYKSVYKFIKDLWSDLLQSTDLMKKDKKSQLQELSQKFFSKLPTYQVVTKIGSSHEPIFTISVEVAELQGIGTGKSKKEAEQQAAGNLLLRLQDKYNTEI
jgi:ribonuclease-3